jgi:hypothetical protein
MRSTTQPTRNAVNPNNALATLSARVHGEYREMPGLRLTIGQAVRLFWIPAAVADAVLHDLQRASILSRSTDGSFRLATEPRLRGRSGEKTQRMSL